MSVTIPAKKPVLFKTMETDFGTTIATALWRLVAQHLAWFDRNVPVGMIQFFYGSQRYADGIPGTLIQQPMAGQWQFVDGSAVNNTESPLHGVTLPNLRDFFLKGSDTIGLTGGAETIDLAHNHSTNYAFNGDDCSNFRTDNDECCQGIGTLHYHDMFSSDQLGVFSKIPNYINLQAFIRTGGFLTAPPGLPTDGLFQGLDDAFTVYGKLVSSEMASEIATALSHLQKSIPVGSIAPIMTNIVGVPAPDSNVWQLCDGSPIINENSPLRSFGGVDRFTPDMRNQFLRLVNNLGLVGVPWGSNTYSGFAHNHTGWTEYTDATPTMNTGDNICNVTDRHRHSIPSKLVGAYNMEPIYYTVKFFMKIQ
jgi:hypothetical protein